MNERKPSFFFLFLSYTFSVNPSARTNRTSMCGNNRLSAVKKMKTALKRILFSFYNSTLPRPTRSLSPSLPHAPLWGFLAQSYDFIFLSVSVSFSFFFSSLAIKSQRSNHTQTSPVTQQRWLSYTETPVEVIKSLCVPFLSFPSLISPSCSVVLH